MPLTTASATCHGRDAFQKVLELLLRAAGRRAGRRDNVSAAAHRAAISLNAGNWREALRAAEYLHRIDPSESAVGAFAAFELGRLDEARALLLHATLNSPRAVGMLVGSSLGRPKNGEEARDHNTGVHLLRALSGYLQRRRPASRRFFGQLWKDERVTAYRKELEEVTRRWRGDRAGKERAAFERRSTLLSWEFAQAECMPKTPMLGPPGGRPSPRVLH